MLLGLEGNVTELLYKSNRAVLNVVGKYTYEEMADMCIMFSYGSSSVIAACHLYQDVVPGH